MRTFRVLMMVSGLLFCQALPASPQSRKASRAASRHFESPDHAVTLQYSAPLVLCQQNTPSCQDSLFLCTVDSDTIAPVACLAYGGRAYSGYNFTGAALAIGIVSAAKDETACLDLPGTKTADEQINGVVFKSSQDGDSGAGHTVEDFVYRAFHGGRCYAADLRIATSNFGNYDPGTIKQFTPADEQKVYGKLKQALDSLRLADAGATVK